MRRIYLEIKNTLIYNLIIKNIYSSCKHHLKGLTYMQKLHSQRRYIGINPDGAGFGGFYLDYYILCSEISVPNTNFSAIIYGVEIEKKYEEDGIEKILEQATVNDIYSSKERTEKLVNKLADNLVMPSTLEYIINDILGESGYEPPEIVFINA